MKPGTLNLLLVFLSFIAISHSDDRVILALFKTLGTVVKELTGRKLHYLNKIDRVAHYVAEKEAKNIKQIDIMASAMGTKTCTVQHIVTPRVPYNGTSTKDFETSVRQMFLKDVSDNSNAPIINMLTEESVTGISIKPKYFDPKTDTDSRKVQYVIGINRGSNAVLVDSGLEIVRTLCEIYNDSLDIETQIQADKEIMVLSSNPQISSRSIGPREYKIYTLSDVKINRKGLQLVVSPEIVAQIKELNVLSLGIGITNGKTEQAALVVLHARPAVLNVTIAAQSILKDLLKPPEKSESPSAYNFDNVDPNLTKLVQLRAEKKKAEMEIEGNPLLNFTSDVGSYEVTLCLPANVEAEPSKLNDVIQPKDKVDIYNMDKETALISSIARAHIDTIKTYFVEVKGIGVDLACVGGKMHLVVSFLTDTTLENKKLVIQGLRQLDDIYLKKLLHREGNKKLQNDANNAVRDMVIKGKSLNAFESRNPNDTTLLISFPITFGRLESVESWSSYTNNLERVMKEKKPYRFAIGSLQIHKATDAMKERIKNDKTLLIFNTYFQVVLMLTFATRAEKKLITGVNKTIKQRIGETCFKEFDKVSISKSQLRIEHLASEMANVEGNLQPTEDGNDGIIVYCTISQDDKTRDQLLSPEGIEKLIDDGNIATLRQNFFGVKGLGCTLLSAKNKNQLLIYLTTGTTVNLRNAVEAALGKLKIKGIMKLLGPEVVDPWADEVANFKLRAKVTQDNFNDEINDEFTSYILISGIAGGIKNVNLDTYFNKIQIISTERNPCRLGIAAIERTVDGGSRRNTVDGGSLRTSVDGGSRRNSVNDGSSTTSVDGGSLRNSFDDGSRRNSVDGGSLRNSVDDGSLRTSVDDGSLRNSVDGGSLRNSVGGGSPTTSIDGASRRNSVNDGSSTTSVDIGSRRNSVDDGSRRNSVDGNSPRKSTSKSESQIHVLLIFRTGTDPEFRRIAIERIIRFCDLTYLTMRDMRASKEWLDIQHLAQTKAEILAKSRAPHGSSSEKTEKGEYVFILERIEGRATKELIESFKMSHDEFNKLIKLNVLAVGFAILESVVNHKKNGTMVYSHAVISVLTVPDEAFVKEAAMSCLLYELRIHDKSHFNRAMNNKAEGQAVKWAQKVDKSKLQELKEFQVFRDPDETTIAFPQFKTLAPTISEKSVEIPKVVKLTETIVNYIKEIKANFFGVRGIGFTIVPVEKEFQFVMSFATGTNPLHKSEALNELAQPDISKSRNLFQEEFIDIRAEGLATVRLQNLILMNGAFKTFEFTTDDECDYITLPHIMVIANITSLSGLAEFISDKLEASNTYRIGIVVMEMWKFESTGGPASKVSGFRVMIAFRKGSRKDMREAVVKRLIFEYSLDLDYARMVEKFEKVQKAADRTSCGLANSRTRSEIATITENDQWITYILPSIEGGITPEKLKKITLPEKVLNSIKAKSRIVAIGFGLINSAHIPINNDDYEPFVGHPVLMVYRAKQASTELKQAGIQAFKEEYPCLLPSGFETFKMEIAQAEAEKLTDDIKLDFEKIKVMKKPYEVTIYLKCSPGDFQTKEFFLQNIRDPSTKDTIIQYLVGIQEVGFNVSTIGTVDVMVISLVWGTTLDLRKKVTNYFTGNGVNYFFDIEAADPFEEHLANQKARELATANITTGTDLVKDETSDERVILILPSTTIKQMNQYWADCKKEVIETIKNLKPLGMGIAAIPSRIKTVGNRCTPDIETVYAVLFLKIGTRQDLRLVGNLNIMNIFGRVNAKADKGDITEATKCAEYAASSLAHDGKPQDTVKQGGISHPFFSLNRKGFYLYSFPTIYGACTIEKLNHYGIPSKIEKAIKNMQITALAFAVMDSNMQSMVVPGGIAPLFGHAVICAIRATSHEVRNAGLRTIINQLGLTVPVNAGLVIPELKQLHQVADEEASRLADEGKSHDSTKIFMYEKLRIRVIEFPSIDVEMTLWNVRQLKVPEDIADNLRQTPNVISLGFAAMNSFKESNGNEIAFSRGHVVLTVLLAPPALENYKKATLEWLNSRFNRTNATPFEPASTKLAQARAEQWGEKLRMVEASISKVDVKVSAFEIIISFPSDTTQPTVNQILDQGFDEITPHYVGIKGYGFHIGQAENPSNESMLYPVLVLIRGTKAGLRESVVKSLSVISGSIKSIVAEAPDPMAEEEANLILFGLFNGNKVKLEDNGMIIRKEDNRMIVLHRTEDNDFESNLRISFVNTAKKRIDEIGICRIGIAAIKVLKSKNNAEDIFLAVFVFRHKTNDDLRLAGIAMVNAASGLNLRITDAEIQQLADTKALELAQNPFNLPKDKEHEIFALPPIVGHVTVTRLRELEIPSAIIEKIQKMRALAFGFAIFESAMQSDAEPGLFAVKISYAVITVLKVPDRDVLYNNNAIGVLRAELSVSTHFPINTVTYDSTTKSDTSARYLVFQRTAEDELLNKYNTQMEVEFGDSEVVFRFPPFKLIKSPLKDRAKEVESAIAEVIAEHVDTIRSDFFGVHGAAFGLVFDKNESDWLKCHLMLAAVTGTPEGLRKDVVAGLSSTTCPVFRTLLKSHPDKWAEEMCNYHVRKLIQTDKYTIDEPKQSKVMDIVLLQLPLQLDAKAMMPWKEVQEIIEAYKPIGFGIGAFKVLVTITVEDKEEIVKTEKKHALIVLGFKIESKFKDAIESALKGIFPPAKLGAEAMFAVQKSDKDFSNYKFENFDLTTFEKDVEIGALTWFENKGGKHEFLKNLPTGPTNCGVRVESTRSEFPGMFNVKVVRICTVEDPTKGQPQVTYNNVTYGGKPYSKVESKENDVAKEEMKKAGIIRIIDVCGLSIPGFHKETQEAAERALELVLNNMPLTSENGIEFHILPEFNRQVTARKIRNLEIPDDISKAIKDSNPAALSFAAINTYVDIDERPISHCGYAVISVLTSRKTAPKWFTDYGLKRMKEIFTPPPSYAEHASNVIAQARADQKAAQLKAFRKVTLFVEFEYTSDEIVFRYPQFFVPTQSDGRIDSKEFEELAKNNLYINYVGLGSSASGVLEMGFAYYTGEVESRRMPVYIVVVFLTGTLPRARTDFLNQVRMDNNDFYQMLNIDKRFNQVEKFANLKAREFLKMGGYRGDQELIIEDLDSVVIIFPIVFVSLKEYPKEILGRIAKYISEKIGFVPIGAEVAVMDGFAKKTVVNSAKKVENIEVTMPAIQIVLAFKFAHGSFRASFEAVFRQHFPVVRMGAMAASVAQNSTLDESIRPANIGNCGLALFELPPIPLIEVQSYDASALKWFYKIGEEEIKERLYDVQTEVGLVVTKDKIKSSKSHVVLNICLVFVGDDYKIGLPKNPAKAKKDATKEKKPHTTNGVTGTETTKETNKDNATDVEVNTPTPPKQYKILPFKSLPIATAPSQPTVASSTQPLNADLASAQTLHSEEISQPPDVATSTEPPTESKTDIQNQTETVSVKEEKANSPDLPTESPTKEEPATPEINNKKLNLTKKDSKVQTSHAPTVTEEQYEAVDLSFEKRPLNNSASTQTEVSPSNKTNARNNNKTNEKLAGSKYTAKEALQEFTSRMKSHNIDWEYNTNEKLKQSQANSLIGQWKRCLNGQGNRANKNTCTAVDTGFGKFEEKLINSPEKDIVNHTLDELFKSKALVNGITNTVAIGTWESKTIPKFVLCRVVYSKK